MNQVFDFLDKITQARRPQRPQAQPQRPGVDTMLKFDFVDEAESDNSAQSFSLGQALSCASSHNLAKHLEQRSFSPKENVTYLQRDARGSDYEEQKNGLFRRKQQAPKIRATALLDASELIRPSQEDSAAYHRKRPQHAQSKQVSLELLRKLGQRSSQDEMLETVRQACEKVSAEALINSPQRRPHTGPLRHSIHIKIG